VRGLEDGDALPVVRARRDVELDVGVLGRDLLGHAQVEAVGELHDVGLVHGRDLAAAVAAREVEGELDDSARAGDRDRLDRDACVAVAQRPALRLDPLDQLARLVGALLELDARVQVLRVLADDHEVDLVEAGADALVGLARPDLPVQVEALAQADVDRAEALSDGRRDRALERDTGGADGVQRLVRERIAAVLGHGLFARLAHVPVELDARRLEHAAGRLGQLGAGSVTGDEHYFVRHGPGLYR
jgi:hypothetical protein